MILLLSINIGNIYAKKNLVEDTADAIAPALLAHQITKFYANNDDTITDISETPTDVADAMLESMNPDGGTNPLAGGSYTITFGIYDRNITPNTFTAFTDTQKTNPDLSLITLSTNQDLAVTFYLKYDASPIDNLLPFDPITLKGKSMFTMYLQPLEYVGSAGDGSCCCDVANGYFTFMGFTCSYIPMFGPPCTSSSTKQICIDYIECQGTFWDNLAAGTLISSFLDMLKCWLADFLQNIISTIQKVDAAIADAHVWDRSDDAWQTI
jgi:hypothetical protein